MSELPMLRKEEAEPGIGGTREEVVKFMRRLLMLNIRILRTGRAKATNSVFFSEKARWTATAHHISTAGT